MKKKRIEKMEKKRRLLGRSNWVLAIRAQNKAEAPTEAPIKCAYNSMLVGGIYFRRTIVIWNNRYEI